MRLRLALLTILLSACGSNRAAISACTQKISEHLVQPWSARYEDAQVEEKLNGGQIEGYEVTIKVTAKNRSGEYDTQHATCRIDKDMNVRGFVN
jgi:hypothetical protein